MRIDDDISCAQLVELVTDYFEGALEPGLAERLEEHLVLCDGCSAHVQQMRETVRLTGALREEDLEPVLEEQLRSVFKDWSGASA
jgi:anti-sigma factor RsiW